MKPCPKPKRKKRRLWLFLICGLLLGLPYLQATAPSGEDIRSLYQKGVQQLESEDYDGAIATFQSLIQLQPSAAPFYNLLGICHLRQGISAVKAIQAFEQALSIDPNFADAHFNLASVYMGPGDDKSLAEEHYKKSIALDPSNPRAYFGLAWLELMEHQDASAAADYFEKCIALAPEFSEAHFGLGMANLQLNRPERILGPISALRSLEREDLALQLENAIKAGREEISVQETALPAPLPNATELGSPVDWKPEFEMDDQASAETEPLFQEENF